MKKIESSWLFLHFPFITFTPNTAKRCEEVATKQLKRKDSQLLKLWAISIPDFPPY
jgi:hypothetical protein